MKNNLRTTKLRTFRPKGGYSCDEVYEEIARRAKGEYVLSEKERDSAHEKALAVVAVQFHLAHLLDGFMKMYKMTNADFLALSRCASQDSADTLLACMRNPYPKYPKESSLSMSQDVDFVYPGTESTVQRSE